MMPTAAWSCVNVLSFRAAQSHIGYRGDYLSWRGLEGGRPIGVNLRRGGAANSSPPPCGEGLGVGVVRGGTALPQPPDPPPRPSPSRNRVYAGFGHSIKQSKSATADFDWGEGEAVARPQLNLARIGAFLVPPGEMRHALAPLPMAALRLAPEIVE